MKRFFDIDRFREIYETLLRNKSRTFLTGFGVFWGIFMLLALMGGGQGMKTMLSQELSGFATNSGFLIPDATTRPYKGFRSGRTWNITTDDIEKIRRQIPEIETVTGKLSIWGGTAQVGERTSSVQGHGVFPDYMRIEEPILKYGRYINSIDLEQERKVCVIGKRVYNDLFPDGGDPCGQLLQMNGIYYRIIGVDFNNGNISVNGSADMAVTIPITVVQKIYNRGNTVDFICFTAREGTKIKTVISKARKILEKEHLINPEDTKAMFELNMEELFGIVDNLFKGVNLLIWLVGFGTLLAAAIGVSNIMMVTVRERTTEIGIRRAIGATPKMILSQIMLESVILTFVFGMIGILFAVVVLGVAENVVSTSVDYPVVFQVSFWSALLAVLILTILGLLAGLAPSSRAMAIKPVDAMRDE